MAGILSLIFEDEKARRISVPKYGINSRMLEKLGFGEIEDSESWCYSGTLPTGWDVVCIRSLYGEEYYIIDGEKRKRIEISIELRADGSILYAETKVYTRYYTTVEFYQKDREVSLHDREKPEVKIPICTCQRPYCSDEDSASCLYTAKMQLEDLYPGCMDVTCWDNNPLEELIAIFKEFKSKTN